MDKLDSLQKIIDQLDIMTYVAESASFLKLGDYEIFQEGKLWTLLGNNVDKQFNTRMAAIGYSKCWSSADYQTAANIEKLDKEVGGSFMQVESISNAVKNNPQISPKLQQAEIKHKENMQELANLVLHIL